MRYKIYQMKSGTIGKFVNYEFCARRQCIKAENYKLEYKGYLLPHEVTGKEIPEILDYLFAKFNSDDRPARKSMHSLSVSDVIELDGKFYFCDSFGWIPIDKLK